MPDVKILTHIAEISMELINKLKSNGTVCQLRHQVRWEKLGEGWGGGGIDDKRQIYTRVDGDKL